MPTYFLSACKVKVEEKKLLSRKEKRASFSSLLSPSCVGEHVCIITRTHRHVYENLRKEVRNEKAMVFFFIRPFGPIRPQEEEGKKF